ncbi:MAG: ABC transporter permease [Actinomycetota bacterium]|nr:ABC transporter permease [Actinomycetota bacterium]
MVGLAFRNLAARKFRAISTAMAAFFGVAMVSGTLLLTDSINTSFDDLFSEINADIDVTVRPRAEVKGEFGPVPSGGLRDSVLGQVETVAGVGHAEGVVVDPTVTILGDDGERVGPPQGGPPHLAISITESEAFSPLVVVEGTYPTDAGQVAIDEAAAEDEAFAIGDQVRIAGAAGARTYEVSGVVKFDLSSQLGSNFALLTLPAAQRLTDKVGRFDEIDVSAAEGVEPPELAARIAAAVGDRYDVRTGAETATEDAGDIKDSLSFLPTALLVFGGIAVFVGGFLIFNAFSITIAQRVREFAMLRMLGASARQVLGSVLAEALCIGLLASAFGIAGGFGFVALIKVLFEAMGFSLPIAGLELTPQVVVISTLVGVLATVGSALVPAVRATRVAPLEALRESGGSTEAETGSSRRRTVIAVILATLGTAAISVALFGSDELGSALMLLGVGLISLFIGLAMIGGRAVGPLASSLGWPIERLRGVTGRLARENAQRQPGRTATTAAALMIGVALVVFVGVFSASLKASINEIVEGQFRGDLTILSTDGFSPIPSTIADEVAGVDGVSAVAPRAWVPVRIESLDGKEVTINGITPDAILQVAKIDWVDGSDETLAELGAEGALVEENWGESEGVSVGDQLLITGPNGAQIEFEVKGSVSDSAGLTAENLALPRETLRGRFGSRSDQEVMVAFDESADPVAAQERVAALLAKRFPSAEAQNPTELKEESAKDVDQFIALIYVLLGLSVIVSVFGVVNTLALTILERTRELGMLRAIGTSRSQVRRMVRYESVINVLLGTVVGAVLGVLLASAAVEALKEEGLILSIPVTLPIVVLIAAALLGVLAAIGPARRASRLEVIEALQYE